MRMVSRKNLILGVQVKSCVRGWVESSLRLKTSCVGIGVGAGINKKEKKRK